MAKKEANQPQAVAGSSETTVENDAVSTYTKGQFIGSSKYAADRDVLSALLKEEETYTPEQVDGLLNEFYNKEEK